MTYILLSISIFLIIAGIIASFVPAIPGPITCWFGLLILHQIEGFPNNYIILIITFIIAITIFIVDYFIPIIGAKFFGGSKYGVIGTTIGLLIGFFILTAFLGPFGFIVGAFLGALIGEYFAGKTLSEGIKPALGSVIGVISSSFIKFIAGVSFLLIYVFLIFTNWSVLF